MKKFLTVTPQQPAGNLLLSKYEAVGNPALEYTETRFPAIPLINGYAQQGDRIGVFTVTYDSPDCRRNLQAFEEELASLAEGKGFAYEFESIDVPFDDSTGAILAIFQKLIDRTDDDDILHACVTYGSKPMPIALVMAMQYAYRLKSNVSIECVVYGQVDHSAPSPKPMKIYDITSLVKLDEIIRLLADRGVEDPEAVISGILAL